jgi:hypothetical protein
VRHTPVEVIDALIKSARFSVTAPASTLQTQDSHQHADGVGISFESDLGTVTDRKHRRRRARGIHQSNTGISLLIRSSGFVDQIFCQCDRGNAVKASTSVLAPSMSGPIFGNRVAS